MASRLRITGVILILIGIVAVGASGYTFLRTQESADSLQGFSEAQDVNLSYNGDGQLIDRGTVEGAEGILTLLGDTWRWPIVDSELDPNDPLVNTATEYMYQMATIAYHTLHGTQTIGLEEDVEYNGEVFEAGTYEFDIDGRYWTDFDRMHPIEGPAREQAWSGTAHGLIGELGVGTVTAQALTMGLALSGLLAGLGLTFILAGLGLVWVGRARIEQAATASGKRTAEPVGV